MFLKFSTRGRRIKLKTALRAPKSPDIEPKTVNMFP
jgi:hypothetical protein